MKTMDLYTDTSHRINKLVTKNYSTSFSLGISAFSGKYKEAVYSVYGFVRVADEIVDSFHGYDQRQLFEEFKAATYQSIERKISPNPILHSFQTTVNKYDIDIHYIEAFLNSMEMDLSNKHYQRELYDKYVYGSAEVVGLMCLKIFCDGNNSLFNELIEPARALGSAFQKVNFLRDIGSDLSERDRIYIPSIADREHISDRDKKDLEREIEEEFQSALQGIVKLPAGSRLGVYSAYRYYYALYMKIRRKPVTEIIDKRVRISNFTKIILLIKSFFIIRFMS